MKNLKTFIQKMGDLRQYLEDKNPGFYVNGDYKQHRKTIGDYVHILPFQELTIGSLNLSPGYKTVLYQLGKMSGEDVTRKSIKYLKLGNLIAKILKIMGPYGVLKRKSLTKNIINSWENMKYGHIKVKKIDKKKRKFIFTIEECVFCNGMKNVGEKICYNQAGLLAGILKGISGKEFYTIETKCVANGNDYCEFEVYESSEK